MRKQPVHYLGNQINNNVINSFKLIAKSRCDKIIYNNYFIVNDSLINKSHFSMIIQIFRTNVLAVNIILNFYLYKSTRKIIDEYIILV